MVGLGEALKVFFWRFRSASPRNKILVFNFLLELFHIFSIQLKWFLTNQNTFPPSCIIIPQAKNLIPQLHHIDLRFVDRIMLIEIFFFYFKFFRSVHSVSHYSSILFVQLEVVFLFKSWFYFFLLLFRQPRNQSFIFGINLRFLFI